MSEPEITITITMSVPPLYSDEHLKLIAFDLATRYLLDKSAGKATPLTQLIQEKMIEMRDEYEIQLESKSIAMGMLYGDINNLKLRIDELEAAWPTLPDNLEGIDRFLDSCGPPTGEE